MATPPSWIHIYIQYIQAYKIQGNKNATPRDRGDWGWLGQVLVGQCPSVPNESPRGDTNDVSGGRVTTAFTCATRIIDAPFANEIWRKITF